MNQVGEGVACLYYWQLATRHARYPQDEFGGAWFRYAGFARYSTSGGRRRLNHREARATQSPGARDAWPPDHRVGDAVAVSRCHEKLQNSPTAEGLLRQPRVSASTNGEFCSSPAVLLGVWFRYARCAGYSTIGEEVWFRYAGFARYSTSGGRRRLNHREARATHPPEQQAWTQRASTQTPSTPPALPQPAWSRSCRNQIP